ncbi:unnamed protein product, partial [Polarella glacialis]
AHGETENSHQFRAWTPKEMADCRGVSTLQQEQSRDYRRKGIEEVDRLTREAREAESLLFGGTWRPLEAKAPQSMERPGTSKSASSAALTDGAVCAEQAPEVPRPQAESLFFGGAWRPLESSSEALGVASEAERTFFGGIWRSLEAKAPQAAERPGTSSTEPPSSSKCQKSQSLRSRDFREKVSKAGSRSSSSVRSSKAGVSCHAPVPNEWPAFAPSVAFASTVSSSVASASTVSSRSTLRSSSRVADSADSKAAAVAAAVKACGGFEQVVAAVADAAVAAGYHGPFSKRPQSSGASSRSTAASSSSSQSSCRPMTASSSCSNLSSMSSSSRPSTAQSSCSQASQASSQASVASSSSHFSLGAVSAASSRPSEVSRRSEASLRKMLEKAGGGSGGKSGHTGAAEPGPQGLTSPAYDSRLFASAGAHGSGKRRSANVRTKPP